MQQGQQDFNLMWNRVGVQLLICDESGEMETKKNGFLRCSLVHETFRLDILCRICLL